MSDDINEMLVERDPAKRKQLREQRRRLQEFIESPGYQVGIKYARESYDDAITCILNMPLDTQDDVVKLLQAVGEARRAQDFVQMYIRNLEELDKQIGPDTEETESTT